MDVRHNMWHGAKRHPACEAGRSFEACCDTGVALSRSDCFLTDDEASLRRQTTQYRLDAVLLAFWYI